MAGKEEEEDIWQQCLKSFVTDDSGESVNEPYNLLVFGESTPTPAVAAPLRALRVLPVAGCGFSAGDVGAGKWTISNHLRKSRDKSGSKVAKNNLFSPHPPTHPRIPL